MPDDEIAEAVRDEMDFLNAVQIFEDVREGFRMVSDFALRRGIADIEGGEFAFIA